METPCSELGVCRQVMEKRCFSEQRGHRFGERETFPAADTERERLAGRDEARCNKRAGRREKNQDEANAKRHAEKGETRERETQLDSTITETSTVPLIRVSTGPGDRPLTSRVSNPPGTDLSETPTPTPTAPITVYLCKD